MYRSRGLTNTYVYQMTSQPRKGWLMWPFGLNHLIYLAVPQLCMYDMLHKNSFMICSCGISVFLFFQLIFCRKHLWCRYWSMASRRNVRYSSLPSEDGDDSNLTKEDVDLRYTYTPKSFRRIPWKSIALALFLLLLGTSLLFLSYFIFTGHMEGDSSQAYGLLFLGFLAFLPGMLIDFFFSFLYLCYYSLLLSLELPF